ncbi:hypothetical protein ACFQ07_02220, partial [Actinomadura adrarensis]
MGREGELDAFGRALGGDADAPFAFYLYGAGGIGKSALLRRMGDLAVRAGRRVVEVDGRFVGRD